MSDEVILDLRQGEMGETPRRGLEAVLCRAVEGLSVVRTPGRLYGERAQVQHTPAQRCGDAAAVEQLRMALARQARIGDGAAPADSPSTSDVSTLAARLDYVLSTANWEQAAPLLKSIEWLRHPTMAKRRKPTRRGSKSSSRRRARKNKKQAGERKFLAPTPPQPRRRSQHRRVA